MKVYEKMFRRYAEVSMELMEKRLDGVTWEHMTLNHMQYLDAVRRLGNPTISQISEELGYTKPSVTTMINKLLKEGIVTKDQSPEDKRVYTVNLTSLGIGILNIEHDAYIQVFSEMTQKLGDDEQEQLMILLRKGL